MLLLSNLTNVRSQVTQYIKSGSICLDCIPSPMALVQTCFILLIMPIFILLPYQPNLLSILSKMALLNTAGSNKTLSTQVHPFNHIISLQLKPSENNKVRLIGSLYLDTDQCIALISGQTVVDAATPRSSFMVGTRPALPQT
jgi:hypothetical protein